MWLGQVSHLLLAGTIAGVLSFTLVGLLVRLAPRLGAFALPGARQSHEEITATGGGLGLIGAACAVSVAFAFLGGGELVWSAAVVPGALLLSVLGWMDDRRTVSPLLRLLIQLGVSFVLLVWLQRTGMRLSLPAFALVWVGLVWVMNMYNFMDGSHGMAGFQGLFTASALTVLALTTGDDQLAVASLVTAACCAGFLPWNFPHPRIFMGDAGSVPLGFVLGGLLLLAVRNGVVSLPVAGLLLAVFLIDSSWTLLSRVMRGERWYTPHKQHVYQRLIAHGWPHSRVLLLYQAINVGVILPALALATLHPEHAWPVAVGVVLTMSVGWHAASSKLEVRT